MPLESGARLGPYEITAHIGAGGMGEVYRARDTRLERNVAIKVLPAEFAADAHLRSRLEREARTISSLNHPNICTLFDVGHDGGHDYLVMELVEGETLADRIARGPMSAEDVLRYGIEMANALDRAHRQGVIHRDLKPGNVMLTRSGVKLLDFGLAKSSFSAQPPSAGTAFATEVKPLTQEGTIVGTFQYMAPEQLEGAEVDGRTDIFALGAVLYEMATGRRAFDGKSRTSLIAAIVSAHPTPISKIEPLTPPALEHVIERCLEKDPDDRWQSARDIAEELKWISAKGSQIGVAAPVAARRRVRERLSWALYPVIALAAAAATWGILVMRREPPRTVQSTLLPPDGAQFIFEAAGAPAISPDGTRVAFAARRADSDPGQLWIRALNGGAAQPMAGTEGAINPFWSPDSRMVAFFAGGKLRKIDATGGPVQTLCDAPNGRGGTWSADGVVVFAPGLAGPLFSVADTGGEPVQVTKINGDLGQADHRWPLFLPGGKHFLYLAEGTPDKGDWLWVASLDGKLNRKVVAASSNVAYSATGHIIYWKDHSLVAQSFDADKLTTGPGIVPIAEAVAHTGKNDAMFSISTRGDLVYQTGNAEELHQLAWFDETGKELEKVGAPGRVGQPRLSHDGRYLAATVDDHETGRKDIWVYDLVRGSSRRLTFGSGDEFVPVWSPDDRKVVFTNDEKSAGDVMMKNSSGTGADEVVYATPGFTVASDWSADGKTLAISDIAKGHSDWDLWTYSLAEKKAKVFLRTPFSEIGGSFSPDGRWMVYQSDESGRPQIYVLATSGDGGKWQISTEGGARPSWSSDGSRILYLSPDWKLMAVDVTSGADGFEAGVPRLLFQTNASRDPGVPYRASADGKRILIASQVEQAVNAPITLVQNWTAVLQKR